VEKCSEGKTQGTCSICTYYREEFIAAATNMQSRTDWRTHRTKRIETKSSNKTIMIYGYQIQQVLLKTVSFKAGRVAKKCKTQRIYLNMQYLNKCDILGHSVNSKKKTQIYARIGRNKIK
jgi:hypothetical protein